MSLEPLNVSNAPERTVKTLEGVVGKWGFLPNILGIMAHTPPVLEAYLEMSAKFGTGTLTAAAQQTVLLAASRVNGCHYCLAAHGPMAAGAGISAGDIAALREGRAMADAELEALRVFTEAMVETAGRPSEAQRVAFLSAGYTEAQMLEVVLGLAVKTLSNYTNHLVGTEVDAEFSQPA